MVADRREIELTTHDSLKLRGILTVPSEARASVLLLPGGGNIGANGDVSSIFIGSGYKGQPAPLNEQLAAAFAEAGIASFRYDKRGFVDPAQIPTQSLPSLISDAKIAMKTLRETTGNLPIFLLGLSEGALIAIDLAASEAVSGVFLLSPPTRPYSEALRYQFIDWPLQLLKRLNAENGSITKSSLYAADVPRLPLGDLDEPLAQFGIQLPSLETDKLPFDAADRISFETLARIYQDRFERISVLLGAPFMKALVESYFSLPPFRERACAVSAPTFVYVGLKDSQIAAESMLKDVQYFPNLVSVSQYESLGHCFAPMAGTLGQIKTSGPVSVDLLKKVVADVNALLSTRNESK